MKFSREKLVVYNRKPLVKKLLLLEGISRSGKFLLANLISGIKGVEPVQYSGLLEWIPVFEQLGLIDKRASEELIQLEIDTRCYEMLIGRNLNFRRSDKSSIFNVPRHEQYVRRCKAPDGDAALRQFYRSGAYSFFILHEVMPVIKIYFDTFPGLKVIHLERSPVDLVYSWYKRGLTRRLGTDPKLGTIPLHSTQGPYPWYLHGRKRAYADLKEMDRLILAILTVQKKNDASYNQLPIKHKQNMLFVTYENMLTAPHRAIQLLSRFLHHKPFPEMKEILKREKLPNKEKVSQMNIKKKMTEIQSLSSLSYFQQLVVAQQAYTKKWL